MPPCDRCGKESEKLQIMLFNNEEDQMLCPACWGYWEAQADWEYERAKEEGRI